MLGMTIFNCFLYAFLAWYLDKVCARASLVCVHSCVGGVRLSSADPWQCVDERAVMMMVVVLWWEYVHRCSPRSWVFDIPRGFCAPGRTGRRWAFSKPPHPRCERRHRLPQASFSSKSLRVKFMHFRSLRNIQVVREDVVTITPNPLLETTSSVSVERIVCWFDITVQHAIIVRFNAGKLPSVRLHAVFVGPS